jgi:hypothetical protein
MVTATQLLATARTLPNVEQTTSWGAPALKVRGKMMACVPTNKQAEPNSFLFRMDRTHRADLLAESPSLYYCPPHYQDYDAVLVRLAHLTHELARDLLVMAHNFISRQRPAKPRKQTRR